MPEWCMWSDTLFKNIRNCTCKHKARMFHIRKYFKFDGLHTYVWPIPVAAQSKA